MRSARSVSSTWPVSSGERDEQVESCSDALHAGAGQVLAERAEQGVTPGPLPLADLADVVLEFPGGDQVGQMMTSSAVARSPRVRASQPASSSRSRWLPRASP
jgi:hypothetical protein